MSSETVSVELGDRRYDILITHDELAQFPSHLNEWRARHPHLRTETPKACLITDGNVQPHAGKLLKPLRDAGWDAQVISVPAGEQSKSLAQLASLYEHLADFKADRRTVIIAIGGGVVGDLAGYAAASYNRGLPFVQVPTTLLANVDSSVGGKLGINLPQGKNLVGAFHQPLGVFIDTSLMATLPDREYRSGLAEVVKYGVILDAEFFSYLQEHVSGLNERSPEVLRHVIARSCRLKADVVEEDEYERTGLRAILNYGHTFAHAYEALAGYGQLLHGEAVAIGMIAASQLAEKLGRIDAQATAHQRALLEALHLPVKLPEGMTLSSDEIIECMRRDKKSVGGQLRFILPTRIGHVETVKDVPEELVREVLER